MYQYIDDHNEGTFVNNGQRYYLSQLYGKRLNIIKPVTFYPIGAKKSAATNLVFSSGSTQPVQSSATLNGKIILLFNIPSIPPADLQYYCYLDTDVFLFPAGLSTQGAVDEKEFKLNQDIQANIEYQKLDTIGKIWAQIKPVMIPVLIGAGVLIYFKVRKK